MSSPDNFFAAIAAFGVLFMQGGVHLLQAGYAKNKQLKSYAVKNFVGLLVATLTWWFYGFGFATGKIENNLGPRSITFPTQATWIFLTFMWVIFTVSIVASAAADRITGWAFWALTFVTAGCTFPLLFNWIWSSTTHDFNGSGWLQNPGVIDYAGSGLINLLGGVVAITTVAFVGARPGRFVETNGRNTAQTLVPHDAVLSTTGTFLLTFTWMAYLSAAAFMPVYAQTTHYNVSTAALIASRSVVMAMIAIAGSTFTSTFLLLNVTNKVVFNIPLINESILGALVAISAGAAVVDAYGAFFTGAVAGLVAYFGPNRAVRRGWDDVRNVHAVHVMQGAWGLFAVGLWAQQSYVQQYTSNPSFDFGAFYGGKGKLLGYQILEAVVITVVTWIITITTLYVLNFVAVHVRKEATGIAVSEKGEGSAITSEIPLLGAEIEVTH